MLKIEVGTFTQMHEPRDKVKAKAGKPGSLTPPCHGHRDHSYLSKEKPLPKKKPSSGHHLEKGPTVRWSLALGKQNHTYLRPLSVTPSREEVKPYVISSQGFL